MKSKILFMLSALVFLTAHSAGAATLQAGERVLSLKNLEDDSYVAGGMVAINQSTTQDLYGAGGQVLIDASVGGDLVIGGGEITVNGTVGDDVRLIGGDISLESAVSDDAILAGGNVTVSQQGIISGDLVVGAGSFFFNGSVTGNAKIYGGDVVLNGVLNGPLEAMADTLTISGTVAGEAVLRAETLTLGESAKLYGAVRYWTKGGEVDFGQHLVGGTAVYDPSLAITHPAKEGAKYAWASILGVWFLTSLLSGFLLILIFVVWFTPYSRMVALKLSEAFWKRTGTGLLFVIVVPVVSILLLVTIIGWALGLLGFFALFFMLYIAKSLAAVAFVQWYAHTKKLEWSKSAIFFAAAVVFVVLKLLYFIPIVGWLVLMVVAFATVGAALSVKADLYKKTHLMDR